MKRMRVYAVLALALCCCIALAADLESAETKPPSLLVREVPESLTQATQESIAEISKLHPVDCDAKDRIPELVRQLSAEPRKAYEILAEVYRIGPSAVAPLARVVITEQDDQLRFSALHLILGVIGPRVRPHAKSPIDVPTEFAAARIFSRAAYDRSAKVRLMAATGMDVLLPFAPTAGRSYPLLASTLADVSANDPDPAVRSRMEHIRVGNGLVPRTAETADWVH